MISISTFTSTTSITAFVLAFGGWSVVVTIASVGSTVCTTGGAFRVFLGRGGSFGSLFFLGSIFRFTFEFFTETIFFCLD